MNDELWQLYEADQGDRNREEIPADLVERDRERRRRVVELLDTGAAETGEDLFHAAMVIRHGEEVADYLCAHQLALLAADHGHRPSRWLAAATYDCWLLRQGQPQKYGTQYRATADGFELYEVDPATTDEERAQWDVPPLAEARYRTADGKAPGSAGGPALTYRAGDLEVAVHLVPAGTQEGRKPPLAPLRDGDPVPRWLPTGLTACRVPFGFAAVDEAGEFGLYWGPQTVPVAMGWREEDGPMPQPETVEVAGRPAILCGSMVLFRRPNGELWTMGGEQSGEDLVRAADSLP